MRSLVDQAALDPVAREFMRHDQSGRTRPDDQRLRPFADGTLHFISVAKMPDTGEGSGPNRFTGNA
jgi:hypothetical protein